MSMWGQNQVLRVTNLTLICLHAGFVRTVHTLLAPVRTPMFHTSKAPGLVLLEKLLQSLTCEAGQQARAHHAVGRLVDAYRCYQQASKLDARLPLPLLGMAQMNLLQKEFTNAASLLETALQRVPGWVDALKARLLGHGHE